MRRILLAVLFLAALPVSACAGDPPESKSDVYEPMAVFAGLAGRAWRGEGIGPNGRPIVDIAVHEFILGGRAFQTTHQLEDGAYGGRTIFFYDEAVKEYIFHYFTTAGFHTTGTVAPTDNGFTSVEKVIGHKEFAEVRSELFIEENALRVETFHMTHTGEASSGDTLIYTEIPRDGVVLFFDEADALFGKRTTARDADDRYDE